MKKQILICKQLVLISFLFSGYSIVAQETENNTQAMERLKALSEQQKKIVEERKILIKEIRMSFKKSLSEEQKGLLKNDSMNKRERRKEFVNSLSEEQRKMYRLIKEGVHKSKGDYKKHKHRRKQRGNHSSKTASTSQRG